MGQVVVVRFGSEDLTLTRCEVKEIVLESAGAARIELEPIDTLSRPAKQWDPCRLVFRRDARTHAIEATLLDDATDERVNVLVTGATPPPPGHTAVIEIQDRPDAPKEQPPARPFRTDW
jgi:hypothetical protein